MKISPIMKSIICPATLPVVEKLYSRTSVRIEISSPELAQYSWRLHPVKKHWCCLPCQCLPYPGGTTERSIFRLTQFPYGNQFDLHYKLTSHSSWSLRIHMPWSTFDTVLYILTADPQSLKITAGRIGSGCLTTLTYGA